MIQQSASKLPELPDIPSPSLFSIYTSNIWSILPGAIASASIVSTAAPLLIVGVGFVLLVVWALYCRGWMLLTYLLWNVDESFSTIAGFFSWNDRLLRASIRLPAAKSLEGSTMWSKAWCRFKSLFTAPDTLASIFWVNLGAPFLLSFSMILLLVAIGWPIFFILLIVVRLVCDDCLFAILETDSTFFTFLNSTLGYGTALLFCLCITTPLSLWILFQIRTKTIRIQYKLCALIDLSMVRNREGTEQQSTPIEEPLTNETKVDIMDDSNSNNDSELVFPEKD